MKNFITIVSLSIILLCSAYSQIKSYKLSGKVTSSEDGVKIAGADIIITGTTRGAVSDLDGNYTVINILKGRYEIKVSNFGYHTIQDSIVFDTIAVMKKDFSLEPFKSGCSLDSLEAMIDIKNNTVGLFIQSGIVAWSPTERAKEFAKKYHIQYFVAGCVGEPEKCLEDYYSVIFPYLDKKYGKSWRNDLDKKWFGKWIDKWK